MNDNWTTDRDPPEDEEFLATVQLRPGLRYKNPVRVLKKHGVLGWYTDAATFNNQTYRAVFSREQILAWMPVPKPYEPAGDQQ